MQKILSLLLLFIFCGPVFSQKPHDHSFGAGLAVGSPVGFTGKFWVTPYQAVDALLSFAGENNLFAAIDYVFHDYRTLPAPEEGKLPLYYGAGVQFESMGEFSVRGVIGAEYLFFDYPFGVFIEVAPALKVTPRVSMNFCGGIGARYYWR